MQKLVNNNQLIGAIISLLACYLLFPSFFEVSLYPIAKENQMWASLDPSWASTLNYVNIKELVWGKDFAFTFGPLSYLITRVGWGNHAINFLLFDFFCSLNFFFLFYSTYINSKYKFFSGLFIFCIALILPHFMGGLSAFVLLAFLLFWIKKSLTTESHLPYIFQTILLALLFYIKFNTGLISFVLFYSAILFRVVFYRNKMLFFAFYSFLPLIIIFISSFFLKVNLIGYIQTAYYLVSGYNEIMFLKNSFDTVYYFVLLSVIIIVGLSFYYIYKEGKPSLKNNLLLLLLFLIPSFVLFKQCFVRADESHIREFFFVFQLILFCSTNFLEKINARVSSFIIFVVLGISIYFVNDLSSSPILSPEKINKSKYIAGLLDFTPTSSYKLFPNENQIPQEIKNYIKQSSVDAYPWYSQMLLENKLNFTPRPVFQSYTAYTPELEELNFDHYNSDQAPKYVIYDYLGVDNRYPLFDEPKLNLLLSKNYTCKDTFELNNRKYLVLEKNSSKKIKFIQSSEYAMNIHSQLIPKENTYYKVFLYRNLMGNIVSLATHAPEVYLEIKCKDGTIRRHRTSKPLLESGLFSTHLVEDINDFSNLMNESGHIKKSISAYYFVAEDFSLFKDKIRIKEFKIVVE